METLAISPKEALYKFFGFNQFKGHQERIVRNVLAGKHTFVIMPTGGGKSLCYQLPALMMEGTAIVVSPLIALMKNQVDSIRTFGTDDSIAHFLNSSLSKTETSRVKRNILEGKTKLLYVAPESLTKQENIDFLTTIKISFFAIDEAHCISEWGHDFRPEYRRLRPMMEQLGGDVPIIALTATATKKVQTDIQKNLGMMDAAFFEASFNRTNLYYEVRPKRDVIKEIIRFIKARPGKSGIVYCLSRKKVEEITEMLKVNGIQALAYHAGMDASARARHQDMFLMEEAQVIVATIAFGMGIDKPDVRYVIHHDIPKSLESYYQETGRAGRDGNEGHCLAFYSYKDVEKLEKFLNGKLVSEIEIGKQLLHEIVSFAETSMCRRKYLLYYFGETFDEADCGKMCDNCRSPREKVEGKDEVALMLDTVAETKERHHARHIVNILMGDLTNDVRTYKHDRLELFGKGAEKTDRFWNAVIRQTMVAGFIVKDVDTYGTLQLTESGREFLENPVSFSILKEHDYEGDGHEEDEEITSAKSGSGAVDEGLFAQLKDLRRHIARQRNVPPFVVFQDPSLEDMAIQYPVTLQELTSVAGVGMGKAERFGRPFVEFIERYVKENDIERPQDFVVRSVVNKSGSKVQIIQNIDRKLSLESIGKAQGKSQSEIIAELESIVSSGTRINIDYYIDDILDEDNQEEIYDYFREAETDALDEAYREFEGAYTEEELRLMRIKFMSEMAN